MASLPTVQPAFRRNLKGPLDEDNGLPWIIPTNEDGYPMLPSEWHDSWDTNDKRDFLRTFVGIRYRQFSFFQALSLVFTQISCIRYLHM